VRYGVFALLVGTGSVTVLAMLIAIPFGIGAAVFLSEYCSSRVKETLKIVIELLAAIPSVVWGFIGISVMNPLIQKYTSAAVGLNVFNGAVLLALMSVPIMVSIGEDALKAVPDSFREAGVALGATKWQLIWRVLLPAARNGLLAAVLLAMIVLNPCPRVFTYVVDDPANTIVPLDKICSPLISAIFQPRPPHRARRAPSATSGPRSRASRR